MKMMQNGMVALLTLGVLIALPALLFLFSEQSELSLPLLPISWIILYCCMHLAIIASSATKQIVNTTFWLFVYVFLGICPFLQVGSHTFPWGGDYSEGLLVKAAFVILVGLLAYDFGYYIIPIRSSLAHAGKFLKRPLSRPTIVLLTLVVVTTLPYLLQLMGGFGALFVSRTERSQLIASKYELSQLLILISITTTPVYVLLVASISLWIINRSNRLHVGIGWKILCLVLLIITLIINNPISTARLRVGTILLSLLFVLPWRKYSAAFLVYAIVLILVLIFPFTDLYRASLDVSLTQRVMQTSVLKELTQKGDFDAFQMVANSIKVVEKMDFQLGNQLLGSLFFWVPRSLWPGKSTASGEWVAEQLGYHFTNLSSPLFSEFYIDGGWLGVILGLMVYGYVVRLIDRWHAENMQTSNVQLISVLVPIYAGYQFFLLRGSLMPALAYFMPMILVALLCTVSLKTRSRTRKQGFRSVSRF